MDNCRIIIFIHHQYKSNMITFISSAILIIFLEFYLSDGVIDPRYTICNQLSKLERGLRLLRVWGHPNGTG